MIAYLYGVAGVCIFCIGIHGLAACAHLLRKTLAMNLVGAGVFLTLIALARRNVEEAPDPVPHGMVLTGIVVAVSATALMLALVVAFYKRIGKTSLSEEES